MEEAFSPVQQEVLDQIGAKRETWPEFTAELRGELRGELEAGIREHVAMLGPDRQIWANKHAIATGEIHEHISPVVQSHVYSAVVEYLYHCCCRSGWGWRDIRERRAGVQCVMLFRKQHH